MSAEHWQRVKDLLYEALQLPAERRASFLDDHCPTSDNCRAELDSLLFAAADADLSRLQESPALKLIRSRGADCSLNMTAGEIFEQRFQLTKVLGEGGMGQVWLAEQLSPMRRSVALKLIKPEVFDASVANRFESERQSLALMDHPAIAKVFEAGTSVQGQPYFVMEYIPGLPIGEYCDNARLPIAARLRLIIEACEGVQHAHQKAIIHRDLKPANILVLDVDGRPAPRIIDFGLAKATTTELGKNGEFTQFGQFVGTPGYMSPDQLDPTIRDIDTRVDVYALGVILYVLLTGSRPFQTRSGDQQPLDVVLRRLREDDPPLPSTQLSCDPELAAVARTRGMRPNHLLQQLRGDLDWIAIKAVARDRTRRYGTPSELAADLRRHLQDEPVQARPPTRLYRLRKYTRRHRMAVGVAAGLILMLSVFSVREGVELHRISRERDRANDERDRANHERDRATRITDFLTNIFKVSDPSEARGNSVTAREILDKASAEIGTGLARDPEVRGEMLHVIASTYLNLGVYERAHELAQKALDIRMRLHGADDIASLESATQLGWILVREGHDAEAEKLGRRVLDDERRILGVEAPQTLMATDLMALIEEHEGHYDAAEQLSRYAMQNAQQTLGGESLAFLSYANHHAGTLWYLARYREAEVEYRSLLRTDQRVFGPDHPLTLMAMISLGLTEASQHHVAEAERLYRAVLADQLRVLGSEHQSTLKTMGNLASLLTDTGRLSESEQLFRRVLEVQLRTLGPNHPETLNSRLNLADTVMKEGRVREADALLRQTLAVQRQVLGIEHPSTLNSESNLASILIHEHRYDEAARLATDAWTRQSRIVGQAHPDTLDSLRYLGMALAYNHRYDRASALMLRAISQSPDSSTGNRWYLWYTFACVDSAAGRTEDALHHLHEAIARGYEDADGLMADDDLRGMRRNAQFIALVAALRSSSKPKT